MTVIIYALAFLVHIVGTKPKTNIFASVYVVCLSAVCEPFNSADQRSKEEKK
jgi:hypothetical protein